MVLSLATFWFLTYGGMYLFVVTTRLLGAWCGVVSEPKEMVVEMMRSVRSFEERHRSRYHSHLATWVRGGRR